MLGETARTTLIILGAVCAIAAAGGIAVKLVNQVEAGQPSGLPSRIAMFVIAAAVFVFALVNPGKDEFAVKRATVLVKPTAFRGRCPRSVTLVGVIKAKGGSHKVRSDLYLSFAGGSGVRNVTMGDGDSVQRNVKVERSGRGQALFVVLSPEHLEGAVPVRYNCTRHRAPRH